MADANSFIRPDALWQSLGLRAEQEVVHLGCGAGFYLIPAARIVGSKGKATGIDIRSEMLAEVENKARQQKVEHIVYTLHANLENTPGSSLHEFSADWVLVANILHQSDPSKVLAEAKRIAKANGHIAIVEWNTSATPFGPPPNKRINQDEIKSIAETLGLTFVKDFVPSPYHFGLLYSP
ncbi:MAG TPA: class I SAM-dependent methyltransferase [Candidatus Andersenbacteria bacterium]|nr:class I SAM-dependent methyltransferase [Candidatus Andersenbacteria bacterium]